MTAERIIVENAPGASTADIARRTGVAGVLPSDSDAVVLEKLTTHALATSTDAEPGEYLVRAAGDDPLFLGSAGTGADAGLRTDLAAATGSSLSGFSKAGTGVVSRNVRTKLGEIEINANDYAGATLGDKIDAALADLGTSTKARLVILPGSITSPKDWKAYRDITFDIRPGNYDNGVNAVTFPDDRVVVAPGARFTGSGAVQVANSNLVPITPPINNYQILGNFSIGLNAGSPNIKGANNLFIGENAGGEAARVVYSNIGIGKNALRRVASDGNSGAVDPIYGTAWPAGGGNMNIALGDDALAHNTRGYENVAIGGLTLRENVNGNWNVAVGPLSQILNQTGSCNVSLGAYNLTVYSGNNSLAIGFAALEVLVTGSNSAIGYRSQNACITGTSNVTFGPLTLQKNTAGNEIVAVGQEAMSNQEEGDGCTAVGAFALGTSRSSTNSTAVGRNALIGSFEADGNTACGAGALSTLVNYDNCFGLGVSAQVTGSNQGQLGSSLVTTYYYGLQERSDERDKADIRDTVLGLDFIKQLRPVDYRLDMRDDYRAGEQPTKPVRPDAPRPPVEPVGSRGRKLSAKNPRVLAYQASLAAFNIAVEQCKTDLAAYEDALVTYRTAMLDWAKSQELRSIERDGSKKRNRFHHGLIAQDVQRLIEETGIDFGGFQDHKVNGGDDVLSIGYIELIGPLIKAVQQLAARVEELEAAA